jgi:chorismate dehydratase
MLRVGIVDYLNSKPLARGLLDGYRPDLFRPSCHPPARVARLLAAGELEIGLIPSIEVQRIPELEVLPGLCVAATHEVRSVLLISTTPLDRVARVALDENSRTSVVLVRILLRELYDARPEYVAAAPRVGEMLDECDAALVIGDPALQVDRSRYRVLDLAAEWRRLTGLPFVFAVWAVAPGVECPDLQRHFRASLEQGLREIDAIVEEAVAELGLGRDELRCYLTRNLGFTLGAEERAGLEEFFARAARHGLLERVRPLRYRASGQIG